MNKQIKSRKKHKSNQNKTTNDLPKNFATANRAGDYRNVLKLLSWNIESRNSNKDSKFEDLAFLRILGDRDFIHYMFAGNQGYGIPSGLSFI